MAVRIMNHINPSFPLTALAAVLLIGGLNHPGSAQDTEPDGLPDFARSTCTREQRDINADCGRASGGERSEDETPKASAPIDLTGYWMSVITEDWRWRMLTPPKGDYTSLPLHSEGVRVADTWDPNDVVSCKPFGAAALMRNPIRVLFQWDDDNTLRAETDHGEQTRIFQFGATTPGPDHPHSLQGFSVASWDQSGLKVVTTHLTAGYLRKNGVPYSASTNVTEYYDVYSAFDDTWLTITTIVEDPRYLTRTFNTSLDFKLLEDGSSWRPTPCVADADT